MATASASKIARWRRCLRKAYYADFLKLERQKLKLAPERGSIIHKCLQTHYNGGDWTKPVEELTVEWERLFDEERAEWGDLPSEVYRILRGYLLAYRDADAHVKTKFTEVQFSLPLNEYHTYKGTIDWGFEDDRGLWIADHKTVKTIPETTDLYLDPQTFMYFEAANCIPELQEQLGGKPTGVVFNHIRTKAPTVPKMLAKGGLSKDKRIDTDVLTYFQAVRNHGLDVEDYRDMLEHLKDNVFYRRIRVPVKPKTLEIMREEIIGTMDTMELLKEVYDHSSESVLRLFPRTLIKDRCKWDCEFNRICFNELAGSNVTDIINNEYQEREERYDDEIEE